MTDNHTSVNVRLLRYNAAFFAFFVAGVHLLHPELGIPRLVEHIQLGTLYDPRPLAFTVSGLAILAGIAVVFLEIAKRRVYLLGIGLMLVYLLGYVAWHTVLEHGGFWPHIEAHGHAEMGVLETVVDHMLDDYRDLVSKLSEAILLALLVVLSEVDR